MADSINGTCASGAGSDLTNARFHAALSDDERNRFIHDGTGSADSDRWLRAVLGIFNEYVDLPRSLATPDCRAAIVGPTWKRDAAAVVNALSDLVVKRGKVDSKYYESCGEPMMVNAMDTLVRFAMTRHDVIGPLCGGAGPDAAGMIEQLTAESSRSAQWEDPILMDSLIHLLANHMVLPVIVHAGDPADDVFDAISAGYMMRRLSHHVGERIELGPLSSCMPYEGPHCGPRLAAMWADADALRAEDGFEGPVSQVSMLVTSMPDAADIGIREAIDRVIDIMPTHKVKGVIPMMVTGSGGMLSESMPPMDWDTYRRFVDHHDGPAAMLQFLEFTDECDGCYGSVRISDGSTQGDGMTWTRLLSGAPPTNTLPEPCNRGGFMSDSAFIVEHFDGRRHTPDPILAMDLSHAAMYPERYLGCGDPRLEAVACCHTATSYRRFCPEDILAAAIQLHDHDMLDAYHMVSDMEFRMRNTIYGPDMQDMMTKSPDPDRDRDGDELFLLDMDSIDLFFRSVAGGLPLSFAMESLIGSIRDFRCGDPVPHDAHGIATTLPYDNECCMITL